MNRFDPLGKLRELRDDGNLRGTEFALLCAMVLRTDNRSGIVRMSVAGLADDAGIADKTARLILARPHVRRYLEFNGQGHGRRTRWAAASW